MKFLQNYNENIVNYDLLNKFTYNSITKLPKLKFININLSLKKNDIKFMEKYENYQSHRKYLNHSWLTENYEKDPKCDQTLGHALKLIFIIGSF